MILVQALKLKAISDMYYAHQQLENSRVNGVGGLWSWITGVDLEEEQRRGDALDEALRQENLRDLESGHYTQEIFDQAEANRQAGLTGDVHAQVKDAFVEGLGEGWNNLVGGFKIGLPIVGIAAAAVAVLYFMPRR